jgi:hypothetical protein
MPKTIFSLLIMVLVSGLSANALPLPKGDRSSVLIPKTLTADYNFEGIVALDNCSGSLVRLENSKDTDMAMILTNGHCYEGGFPKPGTFVSNVSSSRGFAVLDPQANELGSVTASTVLYSTMTKTDMTLYQLTSTYADILKKFNVHPFTLSSAHPTVGQAIQVISGYWKRGYSCSIEAFIPTLKEDVWTSNDSIRYSRPGCEVIGGTSGSPAVLTGTRTIVGVNNTINEDGEECTMDNPCEVDANGNVTYQKGYAYAQETYWIYSCLNSANSFDLSVDGCQLFH